MRTRKLLWGQPDKMPGGNLRWTGIPSRRSRNTPSRFLQRKPEISAGTDGPLARLTFLKWSDFYHSCSNVYVYILDAVIHPHERKQHWRAKHLRGPSGGFCREEILSLYCARRELVPTKSRIRQRQKFPGA